VTLDEKDGAMPQPLHWGQLNRTCDPQSLGFEVTDDLQLVPQVIGQQRAVEAMEFGLGIASPGYNVFVTGPTGTGRRTILQSIVKDHASQAATPDDWVYVNEFSQAGAPRAIRLPSGCGAQFRTDIERFNAGLVERLQQAFDTEQYAEARERFEQQFQGLQQEELAVVDLQCRERGFALVRSPSGLYIAPVRDGEILTPEAFSQLPLDVHGQAEKDMALLDDLLNAALRRLRDSERKTQADVERLDREVADFTVSPWLQEIEAKYAHLPDVVNYLRAVRLDIVDNIDYIRDGSDSARVAEGESLLNTPLPQRYRVNLLVDNGTLEGAPVISLESPTYDRLFGCIEYDVRAGSTVTDHTLIRAGALHRANGGFLILDAESLIDDPKVWNGLKRALSSGLVRIESPDGQGLIRTVTPLPEPIPLAVKVVLQGSTEIYYALHAYDEDFSKLFKVQADFRADMPRTPESESMYALFTRMLGERENLLPVQAGAVARVIDYGARIAEDQNRLSTRFGKVADLIREATYWARKAGRACVERQDVLQALREAYRRASLPADLTYQAIEEGSLLIQVSGLAIGQVNGLTVVTLGGFSYGAPSRITARAYVGRGSVLDIQREVQLGGPVHGKGVLTLTGYFGGQYGTRHSLSMEASLSFEQLYDDIDGDSASSAELYALISSIAQVPLRQDIAVTGAVDQFGRILPVGGINEKIEGFYRVCEARGLTSTQGVLVPAANARNLVLDETVVAAVRQGLFAIYAIDAVDEGLAILTGLSVGVRGADDLFPEGSVHALVEAQLSDFARRSSADRAGQDDEDDADGD